MRSSWGGTGTSTSTASIARRAQCATARGSSPRTWIPTYPAAGHTLPGAGAIVASIATASGRTPEVAGKPEPAIVAMVRRRLGDHGVMVGDRPSTDGAMATALGWPFALVLSGIGGHDPSEPVPTPPPALVADDLAALVPQLLADHVATP